MKRRNSGKSTNGTSHLKATGRSRDRIGIEPQFERLSPFLPISINVIIIARKGPLNEYGNWSPNS